MSFHNIQDPTLVKALIHLNELLQGSTLEPNVRLLDQAQLKLNMDTSLYTDTSVLDAFSPLVLGIVQSDATSAEGKRAAIDLLEPILNHCSFDQILSRFTLDLLMEALSANKEELQVLVIHVLQRAHPADLLANTSVIVRLGRLLADPATTVAVANACDQCLVTLAGRGELVRRRLVSDEMIAVLRGLRTNPDTAPRAYDLMLGLLPAVPQLPKDLYLVTKDEYDSQEDVLLGSLVLSFYNNLLLAVSTDHRLKFLLDAIDEQSDYIAQTFVDDNYMTELKSFFNLEPAIFLSQLSHVSPPKFEAVDAKWNIVDYAIRTVSVYLLSNINGQFLESRPQFIHGFRLSTKTVPVYCNLVKDQRILSKLPVSSSDVSQLEVPEFLEVLQALTSTQFGIAKLVSDWSSLITHLFEANVTNPEVWNQKLDVLESLYTAGQATGVWAEKIAEAYRLMKGGRTLTAEADVMDAHM